MSTRRFGYRKDPADARDRTFRALLGPIADEPPPPSASVENMNVFPKDQGGTGSCVGQAWSQALRLAYLSAGIDCPELSALFQYFSNRAEWNGQHADEGSYLRSGAAAAMKFGCATEQAWPFFEAKVNVEPGWTAFKSAHDRRGVRSYHRVEASPDEVRRAIASGRPVVGGWQVDDAFMDYSGVGLIKRADPDRVLGGHALPITAYESDGTFRVLNSWGFSWGKSGYGICDEGFIRSGTDLWVVDIAKGSV